jgi:hypothetical protein
VQALYSNATGGNNTATGYHALYANTTGSHNIAVGFDAGSSLTSGSNNIDIGNTGVAGESGAIRIGTVGAQGATYVAGINGVTATSGVEVFVTASGQLGTVTSSRRFKRDIHDMGGVTDRLMKLRPVTFRYKQAGESGAHPLQYGLIAEEVAKVYPELVQYDRAGKPLAIYYHLLTPMLLNELQKSHRQNEILRSQVASLTQSQRTEISALRSELASLKQSLAKLTILAEPSRKKEAPQAAAFARH